MTQFAKEPISLHAGSTRVTTRDADNRLRMVSSLNELIKKCSGSTSQPACLLEKSTPGKDFGGVAPAATQGTAEKASVPVRYPMTEN